MTLVELLGRRFPAREINAGLLRKRVVDGYIILMPGPGPAPVYGRTVRSNYAVLTEKGHAAAECHRKSVDGK